MPSFNDHEILRSDLANKGAKITPKQNEELVKFMTQKFDKQYVYWCNRYWHQKEVIRHAENELEMMQTLNQDYVRLKKWEDLPFLIVNAAINSKR